jgi:hypothetical protein
MGADIYLQSVFDANQVTARPAFDAAVMRRDAHVRGSETHELLQKRVEDAYDAMMSVGYFRDSYNSTSLFGLLGISWWQSCAACAGGKRYNWSIDEAGRMQVPSMQALKDFLEARGQVVCEEMQAWLIKESKDGCGPAIDDGENSLTEWGKMFERKRRQLIKLLGQAIALGESLNCSV